MWQNKSTFLFAAGQERTRYRIERWAAFNGNHSAGKRGVSGQGQYFQGGWVTLHSRDIHEGMFPGNHSLVWTQVQLLPQMHATVAYFSLALYFPADQS